MAINKNFVVKNGLEVAADVIVADATTKNVGVGTTVGRLTLDVRGSIGATNLSVTGIGTIVTINNTFLTSTSGTITNLTGTAGTITNGTITNLTGTSSTVTNGTITNLTGTSGTITTLNSTNGTITNLTGTAGTITNGTITNLTGTSSTVTNETITNLTGTAGTITNGTITNLTGTSGTVTTFNSINGTITNLTGTSSTITNGTITNLTGTAGTIANGTITNLTGTAGTITNGTITNLTGTSGTITTLNSTNGTITNLTGTAGTITNGTITNLTGTAAIIGTVTISTGIITATTGVVTYYGDGQYLANLSSDLQSVLNKGNSATLGVSLSGVSTFSGVNVGSGIITATSGIVTYYGDGQYLTGLAGSPTLQTVLNTGNTSTIGMSISGVSTLTTLNSTNGTITNLTGTSGTFTTLRVDTDFDVYDTQATFHNNLYVAGNLSIGGTTSVIAAQDLVVLNKDIILGYTTNITGDLVSNDTTANHGGVAVASTQGTPLVPFKVTGINTFPDTYKQIMWVKSGTYSGLGTDAWMFNYGVGIGSTQFPLGTRLASGSVQFTQNDLAVVRNINASGVITSTTINTTNLVPTNINSSGVSTLTNATGTNLNFSGVSTLTTINTTNLVPTNINSSGVSTLTNATGTNLNFSGIITSTRLGINTTSVTQQFQVGSGTTIVIIDSLGEVGVGTTNPTSKLHVVGDVLVSGIITCTDINSTSDAKLKTNVHTVENALDVVDSLRGVSFDWKESGKSSYGVIAQELEEVLPDLVSNTDPKTVNYNGIIGVLIEAIKELKKEVLELKNNK